MSDTYEHCSVCDHLTGRAGRSDDSHFLPTPNGEAGPLCDDCWGALRRDDLQAAVDAAQEECEEMRKRIDSGTNTEALTTLSLLRLIRALDGKP